MECVKSETRGIIRAQLRSHIDSFLANKQEKKIPTTSDRFTLMVTDGKSVQLSVSPKSFSNRNGVFADGTVNQIQTVSGTDSSGMESRFPRAINTQINN